MLERSYSVNKIVVIADEKESNSPMKVLQVNLPMRQKGLKRWSLNEKTDVDEDAVDKNFPSLNPCRVCSYLRVKHRYIRQQYIYARFANDARALAVRRRRATCSSHPTAVAMEPPTQREIELEMLLREREKQVAELTVRRMLSRTRRPRNVEAYYFGIHRTRCIS